MLPVKSVGIYDVPVANLDWTWMEVLFVARQSGVGIVSPVEIATIGDVIGTGTGAGGWDNVDAGSLDDERWPFAFAML